MNLVQMEILYLLKQINHEKIFLYSIIVCLFSCNNQKEEILQGELHFKLVEFIPPNGFSEGKIKQIKSNQKEIEKQFPILRKLDELNLLNSPHINLKLKDGSIKIIFLKPSEFNKVNGFKLENLQKENNKVYLSIAVQKLENDIFYSEKIIDIKKEKGITSWNK